MALDITSYMAKISEKNTKNTDFWTTGNGSEHAILKSAPYFFKRRANIPLKVHNFITDGSLNAKLRLISPHFEDYCTLSEAEYKKIGYTDITRMKLDRIYVFEKAKLIKFKDYFKDAREYPSVLSDLATFFNVIDKEGIVYHDADSAWNNICINKDTKRLCVVDIDSMVMSTDTYDSLDGKGATFLHNSYLEFKRKYKLINIKYLNICIYHNIFFAFALGAALHDTEFSLNDKSIAVTNFIREYVNGNYTNKFNDNDHVHTIPQECVDILTKVTRIVSSYIAGTYNGNPYEALSTLAKDLEKTYKINPTEPIITSIKNFSVGLKSRLSYFSTYFKQTLRYFEKNPSVGIGIVAIILIFVAVYLYPNLSSLGSNINGQQVLDQIMDFRGVEDNSEIVTSKNNESSENSTNYTNLLGMEFVQIPAGSFSMGSTDEENSNYNDGPVHNVIIEESFYLGKYEVTQKQWREVMGNNPSEFKGDNLPVESVSWNDVQQFIEKLNEREGTDKYRLPSEAEWEYACRAGTTTSYSFGDNESEIGDYAWYKENSDDKTHPVGLKKPNPWGLYDMDGNVWELCRDTYHKDYDGAPSDSSAWESGDRSFRVRRGGVWCRSAEYCNSAARGKIISSGRSNTLGFRILMEC